MKSSLTVRGIRFHYRLVDVREIDGEKLLASRDLKDNVIAILGRLDNPREAIRRILGRIARSKPGQRVAPMQEILALAALRSLEQVLDEEIAEMPILEGFIDHAIIGPKIREGIAKGMAKGIAIGEERGREQGERDVVGRLIEKRFGRLPKWAQTRLDAMPVTDIEDLAMRLLDAKSLKELFG